METIIFYFNHFNTQEFIAIMAIVIGITALTILMLGLKSSKIQEKREHISQSIKSYRLIDSVLNLVVAHTYFIYEIKKSDVSDEQKSEQINYHLQYIEKYISLLKEISHYSIVDEHHETYVNLKLDLLYLQEKTYAYVHEQHAVQHDIHEGTFYKDQYKKMKKYKDQFEEWLQQLM
ncbi:hypothetical protein [Desertibacillus haloalkaliphilus]|uniref:hypothetical protein n=1 Tax=Desertibacillus haloalkaliphilus TaxID=1328930 RepID=UPI001C267712|nr:hypothetical protein [Desertibacillus haloalkaliphilus]MBU8906530.1 hypothetical protein [Desertibacillus haloalkaliphilus]